MKTMFSYLLSTLETHPCARIDLGGPYIKLFSYGSRRVTENKDEGSKLVVPVDYLQDMIIYDNIL